MDNPLRDNNYSPISGSAFGSPDSYQSFKFTTNHNS